MGYDHFDPFAEQAKMMYGTGIDRDRGGMQTNATASPSRPLAMTPVATGKSA